MDRDLYNRQFADWAVNHFWHSLERDKQLIFRHLRTFVGDVIYEVQNEKERKEKVSGT